MRRTSTSWTPLLNRRIGIPHIAVSLLIVVFAGATAAPVQAASKPRTEMPEPERSIATTGDALHVDGIRVQTDITYSSIIADLIQDFSEDDGTPASARAQGSTVEVRALGREVLVVGRTRSEAGDGSRSDATVIAVLGHEVIGSRSQSSGGSSTSTTGVAHETCKLSNGSFCLALLYGRSESSSKGGSSTADSYTALVTLCAGENQRNPSEPCDGPLSAGIGESRSSAERGSTGESSRSSSTVGRACVGGTNDSGRCSGAGIVLLHRDSSSDGKDSAQGASLQVGGAEVAGLEHPGEIPSGCDEQSSEPCVNLNDTTSTAGNEDSKGQHESQEEPASARAEGGVVEVRAFGREIVRAGGTGSQSGNEGSSSDATVLSVLGHEVIGAHSGSRNGSGSSQTGYLTESCEATGGSVCLALLYGRASSSDDQNSTSGSSDTALVSACIGGEQESPEQHCDGPVGATVGESHSRSSQNKRTGEAESTQSSSGADVCIGGENERTGKCDGVGAVLLSSQARSEASPGEEGTGGAESSVATLEVGGQNVATVDESTAVPPGCREEESETCLSLNDKDANAESGGSGSSGRVLGVEVLPDESGEGVVSGAAGESATSASAGEKVRGERLTRPDSTGPQVAGANAQRAQGAFALAATGAGVLRVSVVGLLLIAAGLFMMRRQPSAFRVAPPSPRHG